jgi:Fe-S-cluster-containing dehydrogenase component
MKGYFFEFHIDQCVACHACQVACQVVNGTQEYGTWRQVYNPEKYRDKHLSSIPLSMACNHCREAPCLEQCPTKAIFRDTQTGAVLIDDKKCLGCGYCIWNCPYEAPVINQAEGTMEKCHFCNDRLKRDLEPACVSLCPTDALRLGRGAAEKARALQPVKGEPEPRMELKGLELRMEKRWTDDESRKGMEGSTDLFDVLGGFVETSQKKKYDISFKEEWPLWVFTLSMALVVPFSAVKLPGMARESQSLMALMFCAVASLFSLFHLGKPFRAWRAVANIRQSWLSREIFFLGLFMVGLSVDLIWGLPSYFHLISGFPLLYSIDNIYKPVQNQNSLQFLSRGTAVMALSAYLLLNHCLWPFIVLVLLRMLLSRSSLRLETLISKKESLVPILHFLLLIFASLLLLMDVNWELIFLAYGAGEALGRYGFYRSLSLQSVEKAFTQHITP